MSGTWIAIGVMTLLALGAGLLLAGDARRVWTLFASALVFALAGYAWQGSPGQPGSTRQMVVDVSPTSETLIDARRAFYNVEGIMPSRFVVTADGFSRRGQHRDAAGLLRNGVNENPQDGEAWLALALALTEQTRGQVTPAVGFAFERARATSPGNPAPGYFRGIVAMRSGALAEAREFWAQALAESDEDALGREYVAQQLERLDGVMRVLSESERTPAPTMPPPEAAPAP